MSTPRADGDTQSVLRVVAGGEPTGEELAAVVVAVTTLAQRRTSTPAPTSRWADRAPLMRRPLRHGPGAWRWGG